MSRTILITGGCGFVGSNLALKFKEKYPYYKIIAFDNLKRRGSELNLPLLRKAGVVFEHGDLRNKEDLYPLPAADTVIDAAAEPSVMAGLDGNPGYVIDTNFSGTINMLNYALRHRSDFIFLSTSRVYPIQLLESIQYAELPSRFAISPGQQLSGVTENGISANFPMTGARSVYGATKLASELMTEEYRSLLGLRTVINRCGVIAGPSQMGKTDQGIVALWLARHYWKKELYYIGYDGQGKQVRDILHVDDLYGLVDYEVHHMEKVNGKTYNAGGGPCISASLRELTALCREITGNTVPVNSIYENRKADVRIYITDNAHVTADTGWVPYQPLENIVTDTFKWINKNERELKPILS